MKKHYFLLLCLFSLNYAAAGQPAWIRINQLGYIPHSVKVAVFLSQTEAATRDFVVKDADSGEIVFSGQGIAANAGRWGMANALRLNFSPLERTGGYYIECNGAASPVFKIDAGVYDGTADFILNYMRQQRCGFNPYLDTLCHQHDGFIAGHPTRNGEPIDVRGGWHDASDYLQYLPTSANAVFQLLFAWQQTPDKTVFKDAHDAAGKKGKNGIPDILDEIRWGLEWMARMNPEPGVMFNQIADDRDHAKMRIPAYDSVDYGWGKGTGRPVFFITGKPQGLRQYKNRTEGVSSSAAKFASAFALGAAVFRDVDPAFAAILNEKAAPAFAFAASDLGCTQTMCTVSPYFYEEDNYADDMELAAAVHYAVTRDEEWLEKADYWGQLEEVTPWMELGRARHYQFYPFVNLGHFYLAQSGDKAIEEKYAGFMKQGLECLLKRAREYGDPFLNGIPFIWCSNNLVAAAITQARLYYQAAGDETYLEMEAALRDWLFGCNPWGASMICGLPADGASPRKPHSFVSELMHDIPYGGLVDGPIYRSIYEGLRGIHLKYDDPYAAFQSGAAVYHDDPGDYSSNEPTMDGTASLSFYLSAMEKAGKLQRGTANIVTDRWGATVKINTGRKTVHLVFPADSAFEGAEAVLKTLAKHRIKASFFLTGNCLKTKKYERVIKEIIRKGHYVGGHSDAHLLYASWDGGRPSLVTADSLTRDFRRNMAALEKFGIEVAQLRYFLPPYEHYNAGQVRLIAALGQSVINYTPGVRTAADYTTPDMPNYASSRELIDWLFAFEEEHGLNGGILLIHPGTHESRTDKLYLHLDEIIGKLRKKGYSFERLF
ncbi:MAG: glycoside hydrolase family 9 protein [Prevotellaceae bacterium]|jgi:peptidoglycan/xylan/chitin deacetylase (PgdA/CDA1 family)|nr:glycoside hydrolase family 9 protein [Prevotellaceae bacterium]